MITEQSWRESWRADPRARRLADRHYNRQSVGSPQFVPPGRCLVLLTADAGALWVTSWPYAEYVRHAWAGAMVNSLFRRAHWPALPPLGIVSFIDPTKVRHKRDPGRCYRRAGWTHVGYTGGGLLTYQLRPEDWPDAEQAQTDQPTLFDVS